MVGDTPNLSPSGDRELAGVGVNSECGYGGNTKDMLCFEIDWVVYRLSKLLIEALLAEEKWIEHKRSE